jgi:predicted helicase
MNNFVGNNFCDVYAHTKVMTPTEKGKFFGELSYNLILRDPHFNYNHDTDAIWMYDKIPSVIKTKLNLPANDKGIDIVARINGKYISIQCKFVQNVNNTPSWKSLSTFFGLTYGIATGFDRGYLITNSYKINGVAKQSKCVSFIYGDYFNNLPNNFFVSIRDDSVNVEYVRKRPLAHQSCCIKNVCSHYKGRDKTKAKAVIEMACGTGKTLTSYWIDKKLNNSSTIIFVPSLDLLSQFYQEWFAQSHSDNVVINYILVGSQAEIDDCSDPVNGFTLSTSSSVIKSSITKGKNVIICTYQSLNKVRDISFDFGIFDEAHRLCSSSLTAKSFSNALSDDYIVIKKKLFMTATPKIITGSKLSMDNEKKYGPKIYTCNYADAIAANILVDYKINITVTGDATISSYIKKNKLVLIDGVGKPYSGRKLAIALMLLDQINNGNINHIVTYHNRVESASKFSKLLMILCEHLQCEDISISGISGRDRVSSRKKIIDEFSSSDRAIICSTRLLTEGVNIPIIDGVCFVNSKSSEIDIIQCIGRTLRRYPGKTEARVYLPIFEDSNGNKNYDKKYGNVVRILFALNRCGQPIVIDKGKIKTIPIRLGSVTVYDNLSMESNNNAIDIATWITQLSAKPLKNFFDLGIEHLPVKTVADDVAGDINEIEHKVEGEDESENAINKYVDIDDTYAKTKYGKFDVIVMKHNGYVNATNLCKKNDKKDYRYWTENSESKKIIERVKILHPDVTDFTITVKTGSNFTRGTYVHPSLIVSVACWCYPEFAIEVSDIVNRHIND